MIIADRRDWESGSPVKFLIIIKNHKYHLLSFGIAHRNLTYD